METAQNRAERLRAVLQSTFSPSVLVVHDDSARHAGHAGAAPGGETHFNVRIASESFRGKSRIERHSAVQNALTAEFQSGLHALSLVLLTPEEDAARPLHGR